jgi:2',3'-cyclic-nucleotide 2'-phosphodiesterase (5'-nucleotidase family)
MNLMGYDAMTIGDLDLQLGPEVLRQRIADAQFPVLSANVMLANRGQLLAQPYTIVDKGGRRVGIIGLTADSSEALQSPGAEAFLVLDAEQALAQYASELAPQVDVLVVLSNLGYDEDQAISSQQPRIDLIVGGRTKMAPIEGWRNESTGTVLVHAGYEGRQIGRCQVQVDGAGAVTASSCGWIVLSEEYRDDPEVRALLDSYGAQ